jgi:LacI family transcriptional regulator
MITIRELSQLAGVSTATVSLVLNGKDEGRVSPATRDAIRELAAKHGYRANQNARALVEGRTYRLAIAVAGNLTQHAILGQFSLYDRLTMISAAAHAAGYAIEIVQVDIDRPAVELCRELVAMGVDGFVFLEWRDPVINKLLLSLHTHRIPAVLLEGIVDDPDYTWSDHDVTAIFRDATQRLIGEGHDKIALLDCMPGVHTPEKREGFTDVLKQVRDVDASSWIFTATGPSVSEILDMVDRAMAAMGDVRAFLLTDNLAADVVIHALKQHGLEPPRDARIIGYGDTVIANRCSPKLSHYALQIDAQVDFAMDALLTQIQQGGDASPRQHRFGPHYIEQGT